MTDNEGTGEFGGTDEPWPDSLEGRAAGFISRSVAFTIDGVLLFVVVAFMIWFAGVLDEVVEAIGERRVDLKVLALYAIPFVLFGYYTFLWWLSGRTIGNWILGVQVVNESGGTITYWQAVRRLVSYLISMLVLWVGFLWVLVDDERKGWHDHMANTWVIYTWPARPGQWISRKADERDRAVAIKRQARSGN